MTKKLCKLVKKDLQKEDPKTYKKLVRNGAYFCKNCGRAAAESACLCKPAKL
jgi:hypothetical protein